MLLFTQRLSRATEISSLQSWRGAIQRSRRVLHGVQFSSQQARNNGPLALVLLVPE
jgi:hypothetical protein